jgi:hypothetical protein
MLSTDSSNSSQLVSFVLGAKSARRPRAQNPVEYPQIKTFSLHPGEINTQLQRDTRGDVSSVKFDAPQLPAATMLFLTSGRVDWLNGRYALTWIFSSPLEANNPFQVCICELEPCGGRERHEDKHHGERRAHKQALYSTLGICCSRYHFRVSCLSEVTIFLGPLPCLLGCRTPCSTS